MKRIALVLVLALFALLDTPASAAPKARTPEEWQKLCQDAIPARDLRTTRLVTSPGMPPIKATLAAAGLSQFKEESVPDVLVAHEDGTCGYDNRPKFYQITRRPHEENGRFVIGDYRDGAAFTDPTRRVPEGTLWGAKRVGVEVYLPIQLGACDRDLASCKSAYETVIAERDALKAKLASSTATTAPTGRTPADMTCATPAQAATPVTPPTTPVVAGTVKPIGRSLRLRFGFMTIALACGLGILWLMRRNKLRLIKVIHEGRQSRSTLYLQFHDLRAQQERAVAQHGQMLIRLEQATQAREATEAEVRRYGLETVRLRGQLREAEDQLIGERQAAGATKRAHDNQLAEVRLQRDTAEETLRALNAKHPELLTEHGFALHALDALGLTATLDHMTGERKPVEPRDWLAGAQALNASIRTMGLQLLSFQQQLKAACAENQALVETEVGNGPPAADTTQIAAALTELGINPTTGDAVAQAQELARSIMETSHALDRARGEVGRLVGELACEIERAKLARARLSAKEGADALEDRLAEATTLEGTFPRGAPLEQRVDALDARVGRLEEVEALARQARQVIESNLGPAEALVAASRRSKMRAKAAKALRTIRAFATQLPAPAPAA